MQLRAADLSSTRGVRAPRRDVDRVEPLAVALGASVQRIVEDPLDRAGDLTRGPELDVVDRADRRELRSGAGKEQLVGERQLGASNVALDDRVAEVSCDLHYGLAVDAVEDARRVPRRKDRSVAHDEDVLA